MLRLSWITEKFGLFYSQGILVLIFWLSNERHFLVYCLEMILVSRDAFASFALATIQLFAGADR